MGRFKGGIHLDCNKKRSLLNAIKTPLLPKIVNIPLAQHLGVPAKPIVAVGDRVKTGARIGEANGFMSAHVHASMSGTVTKIAHYYHPIHGFAETIQIESDGEDTSVETIYARNDIDTLTPEDIRAIVKECGVVGLGGATLPTHVKLTPPADKPIDTLIINAAECEPYLTCDHMLMLSEPNAVIYGIQLIMKTVGAKKCYIALEDNKLDVFELLWSKVRGKDLQDIIIPTLLKTIYPHGAEKQQIKTILNREVPIGKLPFDVGVIVQNVSTAFAIYNAVYFRKPLYERIVTVTGSCIKTQQNFLVRIGTPFASLIKACGGYLRPASKIIMGGPMMGIAQSTDMVPVIKGTSGILTLYETEIDTHDYRACIRCGKCVQKCPMNLIPSSLSIAAEHNRLDDAQNNGILACIECGICSYVCPAKRPMVQFMKQAKTAITQKNRK